MKKKLLVICLVLCCVWVGIAAENKLLNAIWNGDLDTIKAQIELLDVDVNEPIDGRYLLDYAVGSWCDLANKNCDIWNGFNTVHQNYFNKDFYEQSDKYKIVIEYLVSKGAELSDGCIQNWITRNDSSYNITIMEYLLEKRIINLNRVINYNDGYKRRNDSAGNLYYSICVAKAVLDTQWRKSGWREKFILISHYYPIPSDYEGYYTIETSLVTILRNDLQGIKELIKKGTDIDSESQLFINNKAIADLLKATDNYKLANFSGYITPYYVGTIIPKYCTQCLTQDEIGLIKLIVDYDSSQPRDTALAKVKSYIVSGVDVNKQQYVLGGAPIAALPKMIGKEGDNSILNEVLAAIKEKQRIEEERIAKEKAEKAEKAKKAAKDKIVSEVIPFEFMPSFRNYLINLLKRDYNSVSKEVKGRYKLKKNYRARILDYLLMYSTSCYVQYGSYVIKIDHQTEIRLNINEYEGVTKEFIENCCKKAIREVFDELVIQ